MLQITARLGSRKTNSFFNQISNQPNIDNTYLYSKYPHLKKISIVNQQKRKHMPKALKLF